MIEIDGSHGEGGGSIARLAVGLSVVTQKPIRVFNIRKNRPNPGLKTQHLQGIKAAADLCSGEVKGAELGSTEIIFTPSDNFAEKVKVHIETAGSVGLVLQTLQIAGVFVPHKVRVEINGGATYGKWAPPIDFLNNVIFKLFARMGYNIDIDVIKHGFYPKGGAKVVAEINPVKELNGLCLIELGKTEKIEGISLATNFLKEKKVSERQKISAREKIFNSLQISPKIEALYIDSMSVGSGITLWAKTENSVLGAASVGEKSLRAEKVGESAAEMLVKDLKNGNGVDAHAIDQLIPFLALAKNESKIKISSLSNHAKTNLWLCEKIFGKIFAFEKNFLTAEPIC